MPETIGEIIQSEKCGSEMKTISFIAEPLLIRRILEHLDLWHERIPKGLPPPEYQEDIAEAVVCEAFDDSWGQSDCPDGTPH